MLATRSWKNSGSFSSFRSVRTLRPGPEPTVTWEDQSTRRSPNESRSITCRCAGTSLTRTPTQRSIVEADLSAPKGRFEEARVRGPRSRESTGLSGESLDCTVMILTYEMGDKVVVPDFPSSLGREFHTSTEGSRGTRWYRIPNHHVLRPSPTALSGPGRRLVRS